MNRTKPPTPEQLVTRLRGQREAVRLAGEDMRTVITGAELLKAWPGDELGDEKGAQARAVIETGMFVIYARPFTQSNLGRVNPATNLSRELRRLHREILDLRDRVYAHTDRTPYRETVDGADPENWFVGSAYPMPPYLDDVIALARMQLAGFLTTLEKLEVQLAEAATSDSPLTRR